MKKRVQRKQAEEKNQLTPSPSTSHRPTALGASLGTTLGGTTLALLVPFPVALTGVATTPTVELATTLVVVGFGGGGVPSILIPATIVEIGVVPRQAGVCRCGLHILGPVRAMSASDARSESRVTSRQKEKSVTQFAQSLTLLHSL